MKNKMKKITALIMALALSLSLAACGEKGDTAADSSSESPVSSAEPAEDKAASEVPVEDDKAKADADFELVNKYFERLQAHQAFTAKIGETTEKAKNGEASLEDLLNDFKASAADSASMLKDMTAENWQTEVYSKHIAALASAIISIASAEELTVQATESNDATKLEQVAPLMATYDEQIDIIFDLLGVE